VAKLTSTITETSNDMALVELARKDPEHFRALYEKYFKRIFVFIHHRVNDKALTADITSQVFLKALMNIGKFRFQGVPFSAWLYRIALNEVYSYFRSSRRQRFVSLEDDALHHLHEELTADTREEHLFEKLPLILGKLTQDELHILELRFFELRPFKEVSEILGITETYAKVKVYRLLDKMKKLFLSSEEN
jgi:RNA polymerase sigma-70 factor (ECF subfamily)